MQDLLLTLSRELQQTESIKKNMVLAVFLLLYKNGSETISLIITWILYHVSSARESLFF